MKRGYQGPLARSQNTPPPTEFLYRPPTDPWLATLYQDAHIIVLSKPSGLLTVPGKRSIHHDSLETRVSEKFPGVGIVHRLDRGTSGIVIMALNADAHRHLGLQFEKRMAEKSYVALVGGRVDGNLGTIDQPLRTDWYNRPKQMIDTYFGREAVTDWQVLERYENSTRLRLFPKTGRSHQLRVHMQYLGHPILGDSFYAPPRLLEGHNRLMLHAETLAIRHPDGGAEVRFEDPCPF